MNETNTPYDDVYRTMLQECRALLIPLINEIFGTKYTDDEDIIMEENEIFIKGQNLSEKRITDSAITIRVKGEIKLYHLECQSTIDGSMLIRMYEYDSQLALRHGEYDNYNLIVRFPESAVIFLRHNKNTPDTMSVTVETSGGKISYEIPIIKIKNYDLDTIFDKRLLFLIPFHIFAYEELFYKMEQNSEMLSWLIKRYEDIGRKINKMSANGEIDSFTAVTIFEMSKLIVDSLAKKYENVRKGVGDVMGGKVLEYEAKTIYYKGKSDGKSEGISEGKIEGILGLVECLKELGHSDGLILNKLIEKFKLTEAEAKKFIN